MNTYTWWGAGAAKPQQKTYVIKRIWDATYRRPFAVDCTVAFSQIAIVVKKSSGYPDE
jgi:hypothetical protein